MEHIACDVLVLGSGAAGLRAAISARGLGLDVLVLSKGGPGKSTCTGFSAGVMGGAPGSDEHGRLERTLAAGRGINQRELAEILTKEAPLRLDELMNWGIQAELRDGFLFAKGRPPVLGEELVRCLLNKCRAMGVRFMGNVSAADLVIENGTAGLIGFEHRSGNWIGVTASSVVMATGGAAALYLRHDNPKGMLGDGCRLAFDAGATLQDMEFVQFYPLCLAAPGHAPLVVPPRLADRGLLLNESGEDILEKYGIEERPAAERARDRLSQALFKEIYRDGRRVYLDLRGVSEQDWRADPFSASMRHILGERHRAFERPLPVAPAAHHTMGGIRIDVGGAASVPGLFAAGEVTGGLHGANRMGGNALSETVVFGAMAGKSAAEWAKGGGAGDRQSVLKRLDERLPVLREIRRPGPGLLDSIRQIMWKDGGILRNGPGLSRALDAVRGLITGIGYRLSGVGYQVSGVGYQVSGVGYQVSGVGYQVSDLPPTSPASDIPNQTPVSDIRNPISALEVFSAAKVAALVLEAAAKRIESRGSHFREDHPEQNDSEWRGHLQVRRVSGKEEWEFVSEL